MLPHLCLLTTVIRVPWNNVVDWGKICPGMLITLASSSGNWKPVLSGSLLLWRTSGSQFWKINYNCVSVSILHINGTENPVLLSLATQKTYKFWIWFWKSDLVLIHFILTQPRTNGLMQVNLWISPILITFFLFFLGSKACISVLVPQINQIANRVSIQFSKKEEKKLVSIQYGVLKIRDSSNLVLTI